MTQANHSEHSSFFYHFEIPKWTYKNDPLLSSFTISIPKGKWTSILGPSGVGKTTLLKLISGLLPSEILQVSPEKPKNIAYMPQEDALLPWAKAIDNVLVGPKLRGQSQHYYNHAIHLFDELGLSDFIHHYPYQLSGGMKQRIQLARLLMEEADFILMDEPFSALDALTRIEINQFAQFWLKGKTILLITHDPHEALRLSDQILLLQKKPAQITDIIPISDEDRMNPSFLQMIYQKLGITL